MVFVGILAAGLVLGWLVALAFGAVMTLWHVFRGGKR